MPEHTNDLLDLCPIHRCSLSACRCVDPTLSVVVNHNTGTVTAEDLSSNHNNQQRIAECGMGCSYDDPRSMLDQHIQHIRTSRRNEILRLCDAITGNTSKIDRARNVVKRHTDKLRKVAAILDVTLSFLLVVMVVLGLYAIDNIATVISVIGTYLQ